MKRKAFFIPHAAALITAVAALLFIPASFILCAFKC
jgi:hypothetical protein